jgi:hypothetical protein
MLAHIILPLDRSCPDPRSGSRHDGRAELEIRRGAEASDEPTTTARETMMQREKGAAMTDSIYRVTEVIGTSTTSWEDAAKNAVETAAHSLRDLRVGEIVKLDLTIEDGHVAHYRARVNISFKYDAH